MKKDILLKWSKKENDILISWEKGSKGTALFILSTLFGKGVQQELINRGYDLETIKFSINKFVNQKENVTENKND